MIAIYLPEKRPVCPYLLFCFSRFLILMVFPFHLTKFRENTQPKPCGWYCACLHQDTDLLQLLGITWKKNVGLEIIFLAIERARVFQFSLTFVLFILSWKYKFYMLWLLDYLLLITWRTSLLLLLFFFVFFFVFRF